MLFKSNGQTTFVHFWCFFAKFYSQEIDLQWQFYSLQLLLLLNTQKHFNFDSDSVTRLLFNIFHS